jgi:hypothetical protein
VVFGNVLRYVSASSIASFDPQQEGGCHRRFWWEKIAGKKPPETSWQTKGVDVHGEVEHYIKTGENVLGVVARSAMHFLPHPGDDLLVEAHFGQWELALAARDALIAGKPGAPSRFVTSFHNIPLMGQMDLRHRRGEWLDDHGLLLKDPPNTAEIVDWKTTSDVPQWAKTAEGLTRTVQMPLYAKATTFVWPDLEFVRLSHGYMGTKRREAKKVSILMDRQQIDRRVEEIGVIVGAMIQVARETDVLKVEPNLVACDAFRGCPHAAYCDRPAYGVKQLLGVGENMSGGFFDAFMKQPPTNGVPAVPTPDVQYEAAVAAEKVKLVATAPPPPLPVADPAAAAYAKIVAGTLRYDGAQVYDRAGADTGWLMRPASEAEKAAFARFAPPAPPVPPTPIAVNPPDVPAYDPIAAADPLPAETIARIEDPVLRERAETHAAAHAQRETNGVAPKAGGRCPAGGNLLPVSAKESASRRTQCGMCGKEFKIKDGDFTADFTSITVPRHNAMKVASPAASAPAAPAPDAFPPLPTAVPALPAAWSIAECSTDRIVLVRVA